MSEEINTRNITSLADSHNRIVERLRIVEEKVVQLNTLLGECYSQIAQMNNSVAMIRARSIGSGPTA
jgi:hypothetical protein